MAWISWPGAFFAGVPNGYIKRAHIGQCVRIGRADIFHPSTQQLRKVGLHPTTAKGKPLEIDCSFVDRCGIAVSISKILYGKYVERGFDKRSLCLAMSTAAINFDPETGKALPRYDYGFPLRVPDCFKSVEIIHKGPPFLWRPTGCIMRYDPTAGIKVEHPETISLVTGDNLCGGEDDSDNRTSDVSDQRLKELVYGK